MPYIPENKYKLVVSDLFIDIYSNIIVCDQREQMKQLSRKELMLLLTLSIDKYDDSNPVLVRNYSDFKDELIIIFNSLPDMSNESIEVTDVDLIKLADETGDKYIDVSVIIDSIGNKLPNPITDQEAIVLRRQININNIIN